MAGIYRNLIRGGRADKEQRSGKPEKVLLPRTAPTSVKFFGLIIVEVRMAFLPDKSREPNDGEIRKAFSKMIQERNTSWEWITP